MNTIKAMNIINSKFFLHWLVGRPALFVQGAVRPIEAVLRSVTGIKMNQVQVQMKMLFFVRMCTDVHKCCTDVN